MSEGKTIADIDARISALEDELTRLKARRNTLAAPLYRLPPEIIVRFIKHAQDEYRCHSRNIHASSKPEWMSFIDCCVYVRRVALEHPEVWSVIDTCWPREWIDTCAERAKDATLIVVVASAYSRHRHLIPSMRLDAVATRFLPSASTIHIAAHLFADADEDLHEILPPFLPWDLDVFKNDIPGSIPPNVPELGVGHFARLGHLNIVAYPVEDAESIQLLHRILSHAPQLKSVIIGATQRHLVAFLPGLPMLPLSDLASVDLSGHITAVAALLPIFPDPKLALHVELIQLPTIHEDARYVWLPESDQEAVLGRITTFWKNRTGSTATLSGILRIRVDEIPVLELSDVLPSLGGNGHCSASWSSPCIVTSMHPLLNSVSKLQLFAHATSDVEFYWSSVSKFSFPRLRHIIIQGVGPYTTTKLEAWIRDHYRMLSLDSVSFRQCDDGAGPLLEALLEELGEEKIMWESGE